MLAPAYPGFEVEVEALNEDPSPIEALTIPEVVEHLERVVGELDKAPIIMGHSAGGFFTQVLLDHGYGAAGVAIDSAPAEGVRVTPVSQIIPLPDSEEPRKPPQGGGLHHRAVPLRLHRHADPRGIGQGLPALPHPSARQLRVGRTPSQLHARPPRRLRQPQEPRPGTAAVHSRRRRQPHASSGQPIERQHYRNTNSVTDYKEFPGRSHYTVGQDGWEEVADYALNWAVEHAKRPAAEA